MQQVVCDEKCCNVLPVIESIYEAKEKLIRREVSLSVDYCVTYYDMHDKNGLDVDTA